MGVFDGCQLTLELDSSVRFKEKLELKKKVIDNGGIISFIVTMQTTHLIVNNVEKAQDSYKSRMAQKWKVPVLSVDFISKCVEAGKLLEVDPYVVVGRTASEEFSSGKIVASMQDQVNADKKKRRQKSSLNMNQLKVWPWPHQQDTGHAFSEDSYEVARYCFLKKFDPRSRKTPFACLEIHVVPEISLPPGSDPQTPKYRVFSHTGVLESSDAQAGSVGKKECRYTSCALDVEYVYAQLYSQHTSSPHGLAKVSFISSLVGSPRLQKFLSETQSGDSGSGVSPEVSTLVDYIWTEASGRLKDVLAVPVESIKVEQVDKAEAELLTIKRLLSDNAMEKAKRDAEVSNHSRSFYSSLPHKSTSPKDPPIKSIRVLAEKQDLCQLIRDIVAISESTNWSERSGTEAKYRALRCDIEHLEPTSLEYANIRDHVVNSQDDSHSSHMTIKGIFSVHRAVEHSNFTHSLDNKQLLFHASQVKNFVGILSRGLLLPKIVVDDFGGARSDPGMLGSGIYFAGSSSLSCKYSKPGSCVQKTRIMLVNEVALGNCKEYTVQMKELTDAPDGYHSAKGVGSSDDVTSFFESDEYVVYSPHQQCLRYLVEFSLPEDDKGEGEEVSKGEAETVEDALAKEEEEEEEEGEDVPANNVLLSDVQDVANPLDKVKAGLQAEGADVPLQSVHVRAQLIDLAAKVVVMQAYKNNSSVAIEAKYVFPLDDMAAVCGFEAFINGKHIVGQVKEKEQAHREYREAIAKGHGAYLMDEETPDVFTVSVGNLPPGASVLIKITYVSELVVEGEHVLFSLPGSVAPWKQEAALDENIQTDVEKVKVKLQSNVFSVQISVEMPFEIKQIESPTHKIKMKQTASMATVELCDGSSLGSGFQLQVGLAEIHVPRMWVEEDNHGHHACMLTFYPEFEVDSISDNEIVFMLDLSNSMKGEALVCAKKILLLLLHHLPQKCLFNIFTFGAAYDSLFPVSVPKTKDTMNTAKQFIQQCCANLGSTDVWRPLHSLHLLSDSASKVGGADASTLPPRSVFLVSDGHVTEEDPTLDVIRRGVRHSRIFTFGVDSTANKHFLRSMAHVGAGCVEFFDPKTKSKWERKVKAQLDKAFQPALTSVQVQWRQFDEDVPKPIQAPQELMSLFSGSRQVVYGFVPHCKQAALQARIGSKEVETMVSTSDLGMTKGKTLHQLTARAIIRDWTDGSLDSNRMEHEIVKRDRKSYIINISKEYSIVSQFTSFVAIEEREKDEKFDAQKGPSIEELVAKEEVDRLGYVGWMVDQGANPKQDALDQVTDALRLVSLSSSWRESEQVCMKALEDTEGILDTTSAERIQVVKELLDLYMVNSQFERAYEIAESTRRKLELSFSLDATQRLSELENTVKRVREVEMMHLEEVRLSHLKKSAEEERHVFYSSIFGKEQMELKKKKRSSLMVP